MITDLQKIRVKKVESVCHTRQAGLKEGKQEIWIWLKLRSLIGLRTGISTEKLVNKDEEGESK